MITRATISETKAEIDRKIRLRLAEEAMRLPAEFLAAGQFMDVPTFHQRGLYGTAAAVLVLAERGTGDPATADFLARLSAYVVNRTQAERQAVTPNVYRDYVARRVRVQRTDTFRLADIAFSLAFVSPSIDMRGRAREFAVEGLRSARATPHGYAIGAELSEPDPLATAHVLRALAANNMPTEENDWRYLCDYLQGTGDNYIKCFVLYVLAWFHPTPPNVLLNRSWRSLYDDLSGEFRGNAEANYEYTRLGEQDYVRIPWQIYLTQACARLFPLTRFNSMAIQAKLRSICRAVLSPAGFRYEASGPYLSTRTYACVHQMLTDIERFNLTQPLPRAVSATVAGVTGVLASRVMAVLVYCLMAAVAAWSLVVWWRGGRNIAELAPNLLAEALLFTTARAGARVRRSSG